MKLLSPALMSSNPHLRFGFVSIGDPALAGALELRLCATLQSVRYFVSNPFGQVLYFGDYTLHQVRDPHELCRALDEIVAHDEVLRKNFQRVLLGADGPFQLSPLAFPVFDSAPGMQTEEFEKHQLRMSYEVEPLLKQKLESLFANVVWVHLNSSFLHALEEFCAENADRLYVNVNTESLDIIRFRNNGQLELMNRYAFKTHTDFIYFVVLAAQELKLDREQYELVLCGMVDMNSKVYEMCYRYFRHVSFITKPAGISFAPAFEKVAKHFHFHLYNLRA